MTVDQFAAAIENALSQAVIDPLPPGHISLEEKDRGGQYAKWRRQGANGKPLPPIYLGTVESEAYQYALAQKEDLERIERSAKNLRKLGLAAEDNASAIVLAALANAGYFKAGGVLVGSRAFRCLTNHLGYTVKPIVATQDVDIAQSGTIRLGSELPSGGLLAILQETGLRFVEVPGLKYSDPSTSWRVVGKEIKLDLLVPISRQHPPYESVSIPELGAHATALQYLDYLLAETMEAVAIGKSQLVPVRVPTPARFLWHKLAVSQLRVATFAPKVSKDIAQAACLAVCLSNDGVDDLLTARDAMSASMKKLVKKAWPAFALQLSDVHAELLLQLQELG
jgi:hypothetical protein